MPDWIADEREWLEADHLGGFAMGTASGIRSRRYHSILTTATTPPTGRFVLVNGVEAWIETAGGPKELTSHRYAPDVIHPDGHRRLMRFDAAPWPTWTWQIDHRFAVVHELFCEPWSGHVVLSWRLQGSVDAPVQLAVRPLLSGRDYHALHRANDAFRFDATGVGGNVSWRPYPDRPGVTALTNARYEHSPTWFRQFLYLVEQRRGLDHVEDLASPGVFRYQLGPDAASEAIMLLRAGDAPYGDAGEFAARLRELEGERRQRFGDALERAADTYIVRRGDGHTLIAGYPWFTDWGRDTFISLRGLCLATGRFLEARDILSAWAGCVSEGMLPNRFLDAGDATEYNSVDASLWFVVVVGELLNAHTAGAVDLPTSEKDRLLEAVQAILHGYAKGTRYGIHADDDGLLAAGEPGLQLTWMDAKVGDWVVTPRIGKPVEVQALWINALQVGDQVDQEFRALRERATESFLQRFPREDGTLYDVVDADHVPGRNDASFRPNQIFAVGGLPLQLLEGKAARLVVDAVEARLWTPLGPRSLDPGDPAYRGRYEGGIGERDGAYHQGTVWPWLAGPFVEAWLRARGGTLRARTEARRRLVAPLLGHLDVWGLGHLPEIADGDPPHTPRGAPFQAWSVAELLRIRRLVGDPRETR